MKLHILGTGLHGLIGSQLTDLLQDQYTFSSLSRSNGVDITSREQVLQAVSASQAPYILHLAAKADVDGCERDKAEGEDGEAWRINVTGTQHLVEACEQTGKTLLYISTDFVFDGRQEEGYSYSETDTARPVNWYGYTKFEGEEVVRRSSIPGIIIRIAYPYGKPYEKKKDFVQAILNRLRTGQEVAALTDHIFTPTHIPDIASAIDRLISGGFVNDTIHIVGNHSLTPFEAAKAIASEFGFSHELIRPATREEFFKDRAERPFNLALKNDRIKQLGVEMKSFEEGLLEIND